MFNKYTYVFLLEEKRAKVINKNNISTIIVENECLNKAEQKIFEKNFRKICRLRNLSYLCNPKTNKAVVVKW